ncbi:hypothetical protein LVB77_10580 [Lysobacter sp. 5GHs7-4]|uniref:hypothetical protein n=1 Tax=Lysobacter sp. 5GHs7-4 TaxID=2904253 RepID=UPI001E3C125E|nr:hypothetical protein [Lysobacter sp. 5GHs7-4]UHQ25085.1 hypothetical protein LVB77_10580 [Lysobacter sp. 5GHs7-4]
MAKPNYSFEKRQREIAKKKKQDEKAAKKAAAKDSANPSGASDKPDTDESGSGRNDR